MEGPRKNCTMCVCAKTEVCVRNKWLRPTTNHE